MIKPMPGVRLQIVAGAYAVWLMGIFGAFYLAHGKDANALQVAVMCGLVPVAAQFFLLGVDWRGLVAPVKIWLAFLLVILISYLANVMDPQTAPNGPDAGTIPIAWTPIVYTLNAVYIMALATLVAGCPDRRLLRSIAGIYCVLAAVFLLYVDVTGERVWGRLRANDIESNVWGLMGLTVCLAAFARKLGPLTVASFMSGAAMIFVASSREHILALAVILLIVAALQLKEMKGFPILAVLAAVSATLILAVLLLDPYIIDAIRYVDSDVLLLYSRNRGLDSGLTGRTGVWAETFNLWLRSPLLGIGYRQHERFLSGLPAHNAYLAVLADLGVLGFIVYVTLLISSFAASWGIGDRRTRRFVVTVIVAYFVIGFFDRRTIDAGNPCSVFFLMCCSVALVDRSLRRVDQIRRKSAALREDALRAIDPPLPAR